MILYHRSTQKSPLQGKLLIQFSRYSLYQAVYPKIAENRTFNRIYQTADQVYGQHTTCAVYKLKRRADIKLTAKADPQLFTKKNKTVYKEYSERCFTQIEDNCGKNFALYPSVTIYNKTEYCNRSQKYRKCIIPVKSILCFFNRC